MAAPETANAIVHLDISMTFNGIKSGFVGLFPKRNKDVQHTNICHGQQHCTLAPTSQRFISSSVP